MTYRWGDVDDVVMEDSKPSEVASERRAQKTSYVPPHLRNRAANSRNGTADGAVTSNVEPKLRESNSQTELGTSTQWEGNRNGQGNSFQTSRSFNGQRREQGRSWGPGQRPRDNSFGRQGWGTSEPNPFSKESSNDIVEQESFPSNVVNTGINFDAYEDIPVESSGKDVPPPISSFQEADLGPQVLANIERCKYTKPTPVQRHAIPISQAGRDLMACAQTGSGKTAAFCFPIISGILKRGPPAGRPKGGRKAFPLALVLSPTRELAIQVSLPSPLLYFPLLYLPLHLAKPSSPPLPPCRSTMRPGSFPTRLG